MSIRTPVRQKAKQLAKDLRKENPDYIYLRELFRYLREELGISAHRINAEKLPRVPTEKEIRKYYEAVWQSRNMKHVILIKTLLYTGAKVSEVVNMKIDDIDFDHCQIRILGTKGKKDRIVPFPTSFTEILAMHAEAIKRRKGEYLFESTWRKPYTERGVHKILTRYREAAGITNPLSPKQLRYFLIHWFKSQGLEEAFITKHAGDEVKQPIKRYKQLSNLEVKETYENAIGQFPI